MEMYFHTRLKIWEMESVIINRLLSETVIELKVYPVLCFRAFADNLQWNEYCKDKATYSYEEVGKLTHISQILKMFFRYYGTSTL